MCFVIQAGAESNRYALRVSISLPIDICFRDNRSVPKNRCRYSGALSSGRGIPHYSPAIPTDQTPS